MNLLNDIQEIAKKPNANIEQLIRDAFVRGVQEGYKQTKKKILEEINKI